MLQRLRSIVQYAAIALTYKIKATGSQQAGEIMVLMFLFFFVLCLLCVIAFGRSLKLGAHKQSSSYVTNLYGT